MSASVRFFAKILMSRMPGHGRFLPDGLPRTCRSNAIIGKSIETVGRTVKIDPQRSVATVRFRTGPSASVSPDTIPGCALISAQSV